jgi:hypothetical protein
VNSLRLPNSLRIATLAAFAGLVITVGACGPEVHLEFAGIDSTAGTFYPGHKVSCERGVEHCVDVLAEVAAFVNQHDRAQGAVSSITLHQPTTADGHGIILRSGGGTWIAVVTFEDGSQTAVMVGCGVGIDTDMCFSSDAQGRSHVSDRSGR